jgi:hypothetical protein
MTTNPLALDLKFALLECIWTEALRPDHDRWIQEQKTKKRRPRSRWGTRSRPGWLIF